MAGTPRARDEQVRNVTRDDLNAALGACAGATVALLALRARAYSQREGVGFVQAVTSLPAVLVADAHRARSSAAQAVEDGRGAAAERRREVDRLLAVAEGENGQDDDD